ncbi:MAG: hypothetical protein VB047_12680 [Anaerotignum propionicum]|uniref:hypothetical protein n=1 Tax=Anaerotignum propionicum TaxID=28446 RepID=UPI002B20DA17|nr:hypothetical protein [Anaerotignum propionicum]MEA5058394.1 hypothetical protein [Anaerotignum propionicum]
MKNESVRMIERELGGKTYPLAFSLQAYAECHAKFGELKHTTTAMDMDITPDAIHNIMWLFFLLNEWGVKYKRLLFGEEGNLLSREVAEASMGPYECTEMKIAVMEAIAIGLKREVEVEADTKNAETTQTN